MTRKAATQEAAHTAHERFSSKPCAIVLWHAAELGYDAGLISGLREAARIAQRADGEWLPTGAQAELRAQAKQRAAKLRRVVADGGAA